MLAMCGSVHIVTAPRFSHIPLVASKFTREALQRPPSCAHFLRRSWVAGSYKGTVYTPSTKAPTREDMSVRLLERITTRMEVIEGNIFCGDFNMVAFDTVGSIFSEPDFFTRAALVLVVTRERWMTIIECAATSLFV